MLDVSTTRIRRGVARRAERLLGALGLVDPRPISQPEPPVRPPEPAPAPEQAASAPSVAPPEPRPDTPVPAANAPGLQLDEVQELFDEMVRPALQADGGDITLVKVEGGDVYVRLVGACSSCPSSVLTMKMGIERLLEEELPGFQRLIQLGPDAIPLD